MHVREWQWIRFQTAAGAVGEPPGLLLLLLLLLFNPFYTPVTPFVIIMISAVCSSSVGMHTVGILCLYIIYFILIIYIVNKY